MPVQMMGAPHKSARPAEPRVTGLPSQLIDALRPGTLSPESLTLPSNLQDIYRQHQNLGSLSLEMLSEIKLGLMAIQIKLFLPGIPHLRYKQRLPRL